MAAIPEGGKIISVPIANSKQYPKEAKKLVDLMLTKSKRAFSDYFARAGRDRKESLLFGLHLKSGLDGDLVTLWTTIPLERERDKRGKTPFGWGGSWMLEFRVDQKRFSKVGSRDFVPPVQLTRYPRQLGSGQWVSSHFLDRSWLNRLQEELAEEYWGWIALKQIETLLGTGKK